MHRYDNTWSLKTEPLSIAHRAYPPSVTGVAGSMVAMSSKQDGSLQEGAVSSASRPLGCSSVRTYTLQQQSCRRFISNIFEWHCDGRTYLHIVHLHR